MIIRQKVLWEIFINQGDYPYIDLSFPSGRPRADQDKLAQIINQIGLPIWWGTPNYYKSGPTMKMPWCVGVSGEIDQWGVHAMEVLRTLVERSPEEADLMFAPILLWTHAVDWIQL